MDREYESFEPDWDEYEPANSVDSNEEQKLIDLKAAEREANYRFLMENGDIETQKETMESIKKDSNPNIRTMYQEYIEKHPELAKEPEQEQTQQQPEQKKGIRKALDI